MELGLNSSNVVQLVLGTIVKGWMFLVPRCGHRVVGHNLRPCGHGGYLSLRQSPYLSILGRAVSRLATGDIFKEGLSMHRMYTTYSIKRTRKATRRVLNLLSSRNLVRRMYICAQSHKCKPILIKLFKKQNPNSPVYVVAASQCWTSTQPCATHAAKPREKAGVKGRTACSAIED